MSDDRRVFSEVIEAGSKEREAGITPEPARETVARTLPASRSLLRTLWTPFYLALAVALALRNLDFRHANGLTLPQLLSGPIYLAFVVVSLGVLLAPAKPNEKGIWAGWWALDASLTTFIASQGLKATFRLPRPSGSHSGFPSGHTLFSFALAWLVTLRHPRLGIAWFPLAAIIGWSRISTREHYPYQVFWGGLIGLALAYAIGRLPEGLLLPRFVRRRNRGISS